jgi:hypothetical protein
MEVEYKEELARRHGIVFNRLYTITNLPISRFRHFLERSGNYGRYMDRLAGAFNPAAAANVMCRSLVSVGWDGTLYDCDFNQMLELPVGNDGPRHVRDFDAFLLARRRIMTGEHCLGCTAGRARPAAARWPPDIRRRRRRTRAHILASRSAFFASNSSWVIAPARSSSWRPAIFSTASLPPPGRAADSAAPFFAPFRPLADAVPAASGLCVLSLMCRVLANESRSDPMPARRPCGSA